MTTSVPSFLARLALDLSADEKAVRRAYAKELRLIDQETDAAGFQLLREAYDAALRWLAHRPAVAVPVMKTVAVRTDAASQVPSTTAQHSTPPVADPRTPAGLPADPAAEPMPSYDASPRWQTQRQQVVVPVMKAAPVRTEVVPQAQPSTPPVAEQQIPAGEPVAPPAQPVPTPAAHAQAVLTAFVDACRPLAALPGVRDSTPWEFQLRHALDDSRLESLVARRLFEYQIVRLLLGGWQPGHEALFVSAGEVFQWFADAKRLRQYGHEGQQLNRACDEYLMFMQISSQMLQLNKQRIARLRDPRRPSARELLLMTPPLLQLWQRYPAWFPIIVDVQKLKQWQQEEKKVSVWQRRMIDYPRALNRMLKVFTAGSVMRTWAVVAGFFVLSIAVVIHNASNPRAESSKPADTSSIPAPAGIYVQHASELAAKIGRLIQAGVHYSPPSGVSGNPTVQLEITLQPNGAPELVKVTKPSGLRGFDDAVLIAVENVHNFGADTPRKFLVNYSLFKK